MLKVKLGKAFAFLPQTSIDSDQALMELLDDIDPTQLNISEEILQGLSGEWLLFDYKPERGRPLIEQYYFSDPDYLSKTELSELQQIIETQSLHLFQTYAVSQPPYVFLQSVFTGKKFKVYDNALSQSIDNLQGSFFGRIAKVGKIYYLVGSNPINFADFITDLMKTGIPEIMCIENIDLFQAMWNYFPHQQLGDKCPHELYEKELQSVK